MKYFFAFCFLLSSFCSQAQTPKTYTSSEILLQIKKLNVLGSVLYIAAHPDDENTRLLAYLANEKMYRTGYLSLTRGDGGQNLIGDEQGIDLGLIRTQELLAARRIDGAEQFFTRAYDFGFCKSSEEALATWGHDKVLSDVVWVVRKFRPDVIIARFPEDSRAGHGHHAASGILAREAFDAAADPTKFPEQLKEGVTVWQAKRMLWNTFNFGGNSTQNESQFKTDVGMYNPLLGKSYGEIAALSRSQHRSQGFGVPAQRGTSIEYFETIRGDKPVSDLFDGVEAGWNRENQKDIEAAVSDIIAKYDLQNPAGSLKSLVSLYNRVQKLENSYWRNQKLKELQNVIEHCSGLFMEATAGSQYAVLGDSLKINFVANNRSGINLSTVDIHFSDTYLVLENLKKNINVSISHSVFTPENAMPTQPYWLENPMDKGSFDVKNQQLIGKAENDPFSVQFTVNIEGTNFTFQKPLRFKFTDPVKGEIYQPVYIVPEIFFSEHSKQVIKKYNGSPENYSITPFYRTQTSRILKTIKIEGFFEPSKSPFTTVIDNTKNESIFTSGDLEIKNYTDGNTKYIDFPSIKKRNYIQYDHVPSILYFSDVRINILDFGKETKNGEVTFIDRNKPFAKWGENLLTSGHSIGYIPGAGDKVPQALEQMGYKVTMLKEADITPGNVKQFDAIITGIRAYNTNDWMGNVYETLMKYVEEGGVLLTQYNTSNFISNVKSKIGPYPFSISRTRVTDETAKVNFLQPGHPVLNYPNKITAKDFEGWVQERSVYHADKIDSNYQRIISMNDAGEKADDGSLIIANYGKGKFVYTGLVFFRELPAGVPGAYRLFANLIAPQASLNLPKNRETLKSPLTKSNKLNGKKGSN